MVLPDLHFETDAHEPEKGDFSLKKKKQIIYLVFYKPLRKQNKKRRMFSISVLIMIECKEGLPPRTQITFS